MQASLLTEDAGFDALFFARADYQDVALRRRAHASEMVWRPCGGGGSAGVFTGTFPNHYGPPAGFNFEWGQHDLPIQARPPVLAKLRKQAACVRIAGCSSCCTTSAPPRGATEASNV
jgi:Glycosyl hydrolases family 38 N-terminal domain